MLVYFCMYIYFTIINVMHCLNTCICHKQRKISREKKIHEFLPTISESFFLWILLGHGIYLMHRNVAYNAWMSIIQLLHAWPRYRYISVLLELSHCAHAVNFWPTPKYKTGNPWKLSLQSLIHNLKVSPLKDSCMVYLVTVCHLL